MTSHRRTVLIVATALAVHGLLIGLSHWPTPRTPIGDEPVYLATADAIAIGEQGEQSELEMLWPPLYPRFLAFFAVGQERGWLRLQLIQLLLLALAGWMLRDLTLRLLTAPPGAAAASGGSSPPCARLAADLVAATTLAFPPLAAYAQFFFPEILHLLLWVSLVWMIARQAPTARRRQRTGAWSTALWRTALRRTALWSALFGLSLGSALLAKSLLQPFVPLLLVAWSLAVYRRSALSTVRRDRRLLRAVAAGGLAALVAGWTLWPTLADHAERYQQWAVAGSGPINLWIGLNDTARRDRVEPVVRREMQRYRHSGKNPRLRQEWAKRQIRASFAERGLGPILKAQLVRQYFRLFDKDSFFTDQLPGGLLHARERGYHDAPRLLASGLRVGSWAFYAVLLVLIVYGLMVEPPRGRTWVWVVVLFILYSLTLFLFVHVKSRYRVQLLPLLFPFAGAALAHGLARAPRLQRRLGLAPANAAIPPPMAPWRFALAGTISALLLFLAFGGPWLG